MRPRPVGHSVDQCAGNASAANVWSSEEILEIADIRPRGVGVYKEVSDTDKPVIQLRSECVQASILLKFAPRPVVHLGWLNSLVEVDVRAEQVFPDSPVGRREFANADHHAFSLPCTRTIFPTTSLSANR